jgi:uncharacterized membrane protein YesL
MSRFFDPDNLFFSTLSMLVDLVGLSLFWAVLCIPVVTVGPATAALYHTVYMVFRQGKRDTFRRFFRSLKENLKSGILSTLLFLPVVLLLVLLSPWYAEGASLGTVGKFAFAYFYAVAMLPIALACWVFPLLGRFEYTVKGLFSNAGKLALAHLPTTLLMVLLTLGAYVLIRKVPMLLFLLPALWALILSLLLERVFALHTSGEEETEDKEAP